MSLLSLEFAVFWLITTVIYFVFPRNWRWVVLLISSFVFYFYGGIGTGYFMLITVLCVYLIARLLDIYNEKQKQYFKDNPELSREEKKNYKKQNQKIKRLIPLY